MEMFCDKSYKCVLKSITNIRGIFAISSCVIHNYCHKPQSWLTIIMWPLCHNNVLMTPAEMLFKWTVILALCGTVNQWLLLEDECLSLYLSACVCVWEPWCCFPVVWHHIRWHRNGLEIAVGSSGWGKRIGRIGRLEAVIAVGLSLPPLRPSCSLWDTGQRSWCSSSTQWKAVKCWILSYIHQCDSHLRSWHMLFCL